MKLSISTLGCPDWDFMRLVEECEKLQVDIEVRGIDGEMEAGSIARFGEQNADETKRILAQHGLKLVGFGTSCKFHDESELDSNIQQAKEAIDVCVRMGIPAIRVFGNNIPDPAKMSETVARLCRGLQAACAYGAEKGVGVNLEIHGDFNSVETITPVVAGMKDTKGFGIVWDIEHSDKTCGDDFMPFYQAIRPCIKHVHIKDYIRGKDGAFTLCLMGEGDIPVKPIVEQLRKDGYDGYFSFEWEKKWVPTLADPEVAFPSYVNYMRSLTI